MTSSRYQPGDEPIPGSAFRLTKFIDSGGFGDVWEGRGPGGRRVALKIIDLQRKNSGIEVKALAVAKKLNCPYLNAILAFWIKDREGNILSDEEIENGLLDQPARKVAAGGVTSDFVEPVELVLAMGLCDITLRTRLDQCLEQGQSGIPIDELIGYMQDAAKGLAYLHDHRNLDGAPNPIYHRDIKPQNLMTTAGTVQICDFGLVRQSEDLQNTTHGPAVSPCYSAPEAFANRYSVESDIYSLAVSYYELRTGELPFQAHILRNFATLSPFTLFGEHRDGRLDFQRVPQAEADVLRRATTLDVASRYHSARAFVEDLRRVVSGLAPSHAPPAISPPIPTTEPSAPTAVNPLIRTIAVPTTVVDEPPQVVAEPPTTLLRPARSSNRKWLAIGSGLAVAAFVVAAVVTVRRPPAAPPTSPLELVERLLGERKFVEVAAVAEKPELADHRTELRGRLRNTWGEAIQTEIEERRFVDAAASLRDFRKQTEFQGDADRLGASLRDAWLNYACGLRQDRPAESLAEFDAFFQVPDWQDDVEARILQARTSWAALDGAEFHTRLDRPEFAAVRSNEPLPNSSHVAMRRLVSLLASSETLPSVESTDFERTIDELRALRSWVCACR